MRKVLVVLIVISTCLMGNAYSLYRSMWDTPSTTTASNSNLHAELAQQLAAISASQSNKSAAVSSSSVQSFHSAESSEKIPAPLDLAGLNLNTGGSVWTEIQAHLKLGAEVNHPDVKRQIAWYVKHPDTLNMVLNNAAPYIAYIFQETQKRGMPAIFSLLPFIESGFDPYAYSHAGAAGLWQMMPATGTLYGLNIDWWNDARRDVITSTKAALNYLVDSHHALGDWYLAAAGYDAGDGAVHAAMMANRRANRSTDFWSLALPQETRQYVPHLVAIAAIVKNPEQYGVHLPPVSSQPFFVAFKMDSQLSLDEISRLSGAPAVTIQRLNPWIRRQSTNLEGQYNLLIPAACATTFRNNLARVAGQKHMSYQYHEVHKGENIGSIAKNYHTNVALLSRINNLSTAYVQPGQGILVPVWLNKKYKNPVEVVDLQKDNTTFAQRNITAAELLSGNLADPIANDNNSSSTLLATNPPIHVNSQPQPPQPSTIAPPVQPQAHVAQMDPISANDSLRSVITKIYGRE